jgi:hypothetical protein
MAAKMIAAHPSQRIGHDLLEAARNQRRKQMAPQ